MLEEALSNPSHSPSEAATALTAFLRSELPVGGASAENRFINLFPLICTRVFGPLSMEPGDGCCHQVGGWFSRDIPWERPSSSMPMTHRQSITFSLQGAGTARGSSSSSSLGSDPVVVLLGTSRGSGSATFNFIQALSREAEHRKNVRYPLPFDALPKSTQAAWLQLVEQALVPPGLSSTKDMTSENQKKLFRDLLLVKPHAQQQLVHHLQNIMAQNDLNARPQFYFGTNAMSPTAPTSPHAGMQSPASLKQQRKAFPNIMLSMLEYYLLMFIRFPLAIPKVDRTPPRTAPAAIGGTRGYVRKTEHYGATVYNQIFNDYVRELVPCIRAQGVFNGFPALGRPSELFVRFIAELWMESLNRLYTTNDVIGALNAAQARNLPPLAGEAPKFDISSSFELVKAKGPYSSPPHRVQSCIRRLIQRMVMDGSLLDASRDAPVRVSWCLSPCMTIFQLPFYNYLRTSLRYGSIHDNASRSPFFEALESWLLWIEPWNSVATSTKARAAPNLMRYPSSKPKVASFGNEWAPYVAANLHLYTVPLALFLRRAHELDFSPRQFDRSLRLVKRVFGVYSRGLVKLINELLESRQGHSPLSDVLRKHEEQLGEFAPLPSWILSMTSIQSDACSLLEEIYTQYAKKKGTPDFIDRAADYLSEYLFPYKNKEDRALLELVEKAKLITGLPADYEVSVPADGQASGLEEEQFGGPISLLKELGRTDTIDNLEYFEDRMYGRRMAHEIPIVVNLLVDLSDWINLRLGLVPPLSSYPEEVRNDEIDRRLYELKNNIGAVRVNLRFLADYRNLIFIALMYWLLRQFLRFVFWAFF